MEDTQAMRVRGAMCIAEDAEPSHLPPYQKVPRGIELETTKMQDSKAEQVLIDLETSLFPLKHQEPLFTTSSATEDLMDLETSFDTTITLDPNEEQAVAPAPENLLSNFDTTVADLENCLDIQYPETKLPLLKEIQMEVRRIISFNQFVCHIPSAWTPTHELYLAKAQDEYNRLSSCTEPLYNVSDGQCIMVQDRRQKDMWCRGIIRVDPSSQSGVMVELVDVGALRTADDITNILPLARHYAQLPPAAILVNLKCYPKGDDWPVNPFLSLVLSRATHIVLKNPNQRSHSYDALHVILNNVRYNDLLFDSGLAVTWKPMVIKASSNIPSEKSEPLTPELPDRCSALILKEEKSKCGSTPHRGWYDHKIWGSKLELERPHTPLPQEKENPSTMMFSPPHNDKSTKFVEPVKIERHLTPPTHDHDYTTEGVQPVKIDGTHTPMLRDEKTAECVEPVKTEKPYATPPCNDKITKCVEQVEVEGHFSPLPHDDTTIECIEQLTIRNQSPPPHDHDNTTEGIEPVKIVRTHTPLFREDKTAELKTEKPNTTLLCTDNATMCIDRVEVEEHLAPFSHYDETIECIEQLTIRNQTPTPHDHDNTTEGIEPVKIVRTHTPLLREDKTAEYVESVKTEKPNTTLLCTDNATTCVDRVEVEDHLAPLSHDDETIECIEAVTNRNQTPPPQDHDNTTEGVEPVTIGRSHTPPTRDDKKDVCVEPVKIEGTHTPLQEEEEQSAMFSQPCDENNVTPMPPLHGEGVYVSYTDEDQVWLHRSQDVDLLHHLCTIASTLSPDTLLPVTSVEAGKLYLVWYVEEGGEEEGGVWNRGQIQSYQRSSPTTTTTSSISEVTVYFVDYGNTCITTLDQMCQLPPELLTPEPLCFSYRLEKEEDGPWDHLNLVTLLQDCMDEEFIFESRQDDPEAFTLFLLGQDRLGAVGSLRAHSQTDYHVQVTSPVSLPCSEEAEKNHKEVSSETMKKSQKEGSTETMKKNQKEESNTNTPSVMVSGLGATLMALRRNQTQCDPSETEEEYSTEESK